MDYLTVSKIKRFVATYFKVDVALFDAETKEKPVTTYRMIAMYFSKLYTENTLKYVGSMFGNRDHATVIHAISSVDNQINSSDYFANMMFDLKDKLEIELGIAEESIDNPTIDGAYETRI